MKHEYIKMKHNNFLLFYSQKQLVEVVHDNVLSSKVNNDDLMKILFFPFNIFQFDNVNVYLLKRFQNSPQ